MDLNDKEGDTKSRDSTTCIIGWVNLYQKFEIEKYTVCGFFGHNWLANLHGFANICKLPVSNTFKDMQSKI